MGDRERRKRKLREKKAKENQRQARRRATVAAASAHDRARERALVEEDRKLREVRRPSEADYEAKLALLRSISPTERERFVDDLLHDPEKDFEIDDMLDLFAWELEGRTSDEALRQALRDPDLRWFEQIEAVERAGLTDEVDLLRALVRAAEYPLTRQEREEQEARWRAHYDEAAATPDDQEANGPSPEDWIASLAPLSSGLGRFRRPRS
jgi:hypothetical protein